MTSNLVQEPVSVGQALRAEQDKDDRWPLMEVIIRHCPINPVTQYFQRGVSFPTRERSSSKSDGTLNSIPPAIPIPKV
jgi:hypothetical protein